MLKHLMQLSWVPVLVAGIIGGYSVGSSSSVSSQTPQMANCPDEPPGPCKDQTGNLNMADGVQQPPEWRTKVPAENLWPGLRTMWVQQPKNATYWSIDDIEKVHPQLAAADQRGTKVDPNTLLHDFPYWTRTHAFFIEHVPQITTGDTAQQHLGYAQFIVVMGGTGTVQAGGTLNSPAILTENGQPINGELRGRSIGGGETFQLSKGDWVSIPGNMPTQFKAGGPDGLTYMVIKVNAQQYPWEFIR